MARNERRFKLKFTEESKAQIKSLKLTPAARADYKATVKALKLLEQNPRHNSLISHPYHSREGPNREPIFESYAQAKRPSPYRVVWYYGSERRTIVVYDIVPHP